MKYSIIIYILILSFTACKSNKDLPEELSVGTQLDFVPIYQPGPHIFVYKTHSDYNNKVPIILSDNRKEIISYPDPSDIVVNGLYKTPTDLKGGYLLDNIGIGKNVAFINLSYEEYARLDNTPSLDEFFKLIISDKPLLELYDCGLKSAFTDEVNQLNLIIKANKLEAIFKRIL